MAQALPPSGDIRPKPFRKGSLTEIPNLYVFLTTKEDRDQVRFMTGSRSKGCIQSYNRVFGRLQSFLETKHKDLTTLSPSLICDYLMFLEETMPVYGYAQTIPGAIEFLCETFDWPKIWRGRVPRCYESLMRHCALLRPETKKAELVPDGALEAVISAEVIPHLENIQQVPTSLLCLSCIV